MKKWGKSALPVMALLALLGSASVYGAGNDGMVFSVGGMDLNAKDGPMAKAQLGLATLYENYKAHQAKGGSKHDFKPKNQQLRVTEGYVVIDAVASDDPEALRADLEALGMKNATVYGFTVSGRLPIAAIADMAALKSLRFARPALATTRGGSVTTQGDQAMFANLARSTFNVDGTGIKVGTLSDSYDCYGVRGDTPDAAADIASGDLPEGVIVLKEINDCTRGIDEGRAMMQLIHDVAPGADQLFHTAFGGQPIFAQGIGELAAAGALVIVDDVIYLT